MRSGLARLAMITGLLAAAAPEVQARAEVLDDQGRLRVLARIERSSRSAGRMMSLAQLDDLARRRRRARQTHPGKRGKR